MARVLVSEAEKVYVLHGVQEDIRVDGRRRGDLRPLMVESDLVTHTSGSAHLRLANTDILVGVKGCHSECLYGYISICVQYFCKSHVQSSAKRWVPGLVNFVHALAYHFCPALVAAFTQPGAHLFAEPCTSKSLHLRSHKYT